MPDGHDVLAWLPMSGPPIARHAGQNDPGLKRIVDLAKGLPAGNDGHRVGWWREEAISDIRPEPNRDGRIG